MSVKTTRPHSFPAIAPGGVLNVKYWTPGGWFMGLRIQGVEYIGLTVPTVRLPSWMGSSPRVVEAPTLTSQSASAFPFGKEVSTSPTKLFGRVCWVLVNMATSDQGTGPPCSQMLCQCEAKTRPPASA